MDFMRTALPSKANDAMTGQMRATVYASVLSDFTNAALSYMAARAIRELDWFPTPRQCLAILADWQEPVSARGRADSLCLTYWQGRFEAFVAALEAGTATADDVSRARPRWCAIACERGLLRRMDDGGYVIAALWQRPRRIRPADDGVAEREDAA